MADCRDRNGLRILDRQECLDLLVASRIARLGYVSGTIAKVIPLNITAVGDSVLFRLGTGGALAAIESSQLVTLEVDDFDEETCRGWSVAVTGVAAEVPAALVAARDLGGPSAVRGSAGRVFRLRLDGP